MATSSQEQVDLGNQAASRRAVRRLQAHGKMLAAEHLGKRARGTAPPIVDGLAAKDVESHCSDTLCSSDVSQRCAAAPQPGRFRQQFQGNWDLWLGREGTHPLGPNRQVTENTSLFVAAPPLYSSSVKHAARATILIVCGPTGGAALTPASAHHARAGAGRLAKRKPQRRRKYCRGFLPRSLA